MGAKTADEWARFVHESAKMMKRVDHDIELAVASIPDLDWNAKVLRETGDLLDWVSIHGYWSRASHEGVFETDYDRIIARAFQPEERIVAVKHILGALGYLGKLRIAFDEWNLRDWCHPHFMMFGPADHSVTDRNEINSNYNMADAVFTACFLNSCLRHSDVVAMANFSPAVNTVGAIYTYEEGIVLRPSYHVFDLFTNHTFDQILHSALASPSFDVTSDQGTSTAVPHLDAVATRDTATGQVGITLVNLHSEDAISCRVRGLDPDRYCGATARTVNGNAVDAYNDVDRPDEVSISKCRLSIDATKDFDVECPPHSVTVLNLN